MGEDVAPAAAATATAGAASAPNAVDGAKDTFWTSQPSEGPVSLTLELSELTRVTAVSIDWKTAAKSFKVQIAGDGPWVTFGSIEGNALASNTVRGASALAKKIRIVMTEPGSAGAAYAVTAVRVLAAPLKMGVQDCAQASAAQGADKFFVQQVAEFDPKASAPVRSAAPLLASAMRDLGAITSDLVAAFPKLESCRASLLEVGNASKWESAVALVATSRRATGADDSAVQVRARSVVCVGKRPRNTEFNI